MKTVESVAKCFVLEIVSTSSGWSVCAGAGCAAAGNRVCASACRSVASGYAHTRARSGTGADGSCHACSTELLHD